MKAYCVCDLLKYLQIDKTSFSYTGRNKFATQLNRYQEQGQITGSFLVTSMLFVEHMSTQSDEFGIVIVFTEGCHSINSIEFEYTDRRLRVNWAWESSEI